MWRSILIFLLLTCHYGMIAWSQNSPAGHGTDQPLRLEIPARSVNETYRVIPCGTSGLIMFFRSQEDAGDGRTNWYFACYDTNMRQTWIKSVPIIIDLEYRLNHAGTDTLALLFVQNSRSKKSGNFYGILRIVPGNGKLILNTGSLENDMVVRAFGIHADRAWVGVSAKGQSDKLVTINLNSGASRQLPLGAGEQLSLVWMEPDSVQPLLSAIVSRQVSKKKSEYYFVRYDTNGVIRQEGLIGNQTGEQTLTQARAVTISPGTELLLGSYGLGEESSAQKNRTIEGSAGLFASRITKGTRQAVSYYNFLELQNVGSVVGEDDIMDLKKKALKKKKPLSEYSLDYALLMHDVLHDTDQYIVTADLFSPQYHTESFTDFDFYGRPYTNSYSVFDGYRFFAAVVAGFDPEGKLLWDNNIEIRNLVSQELTPKTVSFSSGGDLVLCYVSDGKIGSKIIRGNNVVEKLDFAAIDLLYPDDKLLSEYKSTLVHWYGDYFISSGYQEIKNIALENNNKRLVFYFSKLRFEK